MKQQVVEVLTETTTSAVIRWPGQRLPCAVIPGDVLVKMLHDAQDLYDQVQAYQRTASLAHDLVTTLTSQVSIYKSVTKKPPVDLAD